MSQPSLSDLLQQAQALQDKLRHMQEEVATKTVSGQSGGGMVKVVVDGALQLRSVTIEPALLSANDQPMLEDLIVVAVNDALRQAQAMVAAEMGKVAGPLAGFKLPGMGD